MATSMNSPSTGEISNLNIDDLFAPLSETHRLGGSGPFVINLSASTAPISLPVTRIADGQGAHMYQIQRNEDRRIRYRLRLGPFANEDEADTVLKLVREVYPTALTATADADDLRAIAAIEAKAEGSPAAANAPRTAAPESRVAVPQLRLAAPQPDTAAPGAVTVESTLTVRPLSKLELENNDVLRWFVIELSLADHAFDPDTVPVLDIFNVYRLYSVAEIDQGRIMHSLRLGFFSEENAARAVASYLAGYYDKPTIKRVSVAERERFADQRIEPRKDVGATGTHAAIEITNERYVRERSRPVHAQGSEAPGALVGARTRSR